MQCCLNFWLPIFSKVQVIYFTLLDVFNSPNDNITILDEFGDFVRITHSDFVFYTVWWTTPSRYGRSSEETILAEFEMHEPPFQFVFDLTHIVLIGLIKRLQLCTDDISQLVSGYNGWVNCVLR